MDRAVLTVAVGERKFGDAAIGLGRSLSLIGDPTPRIVVTDLKGYPWDRYFDVVIEGSDAVQDRDVLHVKSAADRLLILTPCALAFQRLGPVFDFFEGAGHGMIDGIDAESLSYVGLGNSIRSASSSDPFFAFNFREHCGPVYLDIRRNRCVVQGDLGQQRKPFLFLYPSIADGVQKLVPLYHLRDLELYEDRHPFGYFSRWSKFNRSIQRRILKMQGRI